MPEDFQREWDKWRLIQFGFWGLLITLIPTTAIINYLLGEMWAEVGSALWAGAWIIMLILKYNWRCPRCRKRFHSTCWLHHAPVSQCLHCKLPKYAETSADSAGRFLD